MKIHRFIGDYDIAAEKIHAKDKRLTHRILSVLRIKNGNKIILCDGKGNEAIFSLKLEEKNLFFLREGGVKKAWMPEKNISLFVSILKKENFEFVVQKATELGVKKIIPVISSRTVKTGVNMDRLKKIALEAAEQSGRGNVPEINEPILFGEAILFRGKKAILNPEGRGKIPFGSDAIFIGPEGGWTDDEIKLADSCGAEKISFGKMIMRAETAAIVASFVFSRAE